MNSSAWHRMQTVHGINAVFCLYVLWRHYFLSELWKLKSGKNSTLLLLKLFTFFKSSSVQLWQCLTPVSSQIHQNLIICTNHFKYSLLEMKWAILIQYWTGLRSGTMNKANNCNEREFKLFLYGNKVTLCIYSSLIKLYWPIHFHEHV